MLRRTVGAVMLAAKAVMVGAFSAMIALTLLQVVNRYAIGLTLFWTEELIVLLLVWSMLLGLPVQLWEHEEIVVDVWPLADERLARAKWLLATACSILFCAVLAWTGWAFTERGMIAASPALGLSRGWFFGPIPLSAALAVLALLARRRAPSVGIEA